MVLKTIGRSKKKNKARYDITDVILKDISKIIKEFEKLLYQGYVRKRTKHEPTDSYLYLARYIHKCMMRAHNLNLYVHSVITEMTSTQWITILRVCSSAESESKRVIADENRSGVYPTGRDIIIRLIINESSANTSKPESV